jgi:hypothetical protein
MKIEELFNNPREGFINPTALYKKAKEQNIKISYKDINEYYKNQPITQIMHQTRKPKQYNSIVASYSRDIYQLDLIIYDRYTYHNYKYIMVVVDIYSRYAEARAMTNRKMTTIIKTFEDIIKVMGIPRKIECDNEFNKAEFIDLLENDNISAIFSNPEQLNKNAIVERLNGTIANKLQKVRIALNRYDWYNYLSDVMYNYNSTVHSTVKQKPIDIWNRKANNMQTVNVVESTFAVGDKVRVMKKRKVFDKGDSVKYSTETYQVESTTNRGNIHLLGISRIYKPYELIKISNLIEHATIQEPKTEILVNKLNQLHKRLDINDENIIHETRIRKPKINNY